MHNHDPASYGKERVQRQRFCRGPFVMRKLWGDRRLPSLHPKTWEESARSKTRQSPWRIAPLSGIQAVVAAELTAA